MSDPRKYTNKLLEAVAEGLLDKDVVILALVNYMSEYEVKDMMSMNEFYLDDDDDENSEDEEGEE